MNSNNAWRFGCWKNFFNKYVSLFIFILISFLNGEKLDRIQIFSTVGIDHFARAFQLSDGSIVNCFIYDTCGQERFNSINESYYKKADAILLVYSIASLTSFRKIKKYYVDKIKECCKEDIPILLLGNKTDLEQNRQVTKDMGIELALKEKYEFKESSCMENTNVAGAFESLIERWNFQNHSENQLIYTKSIRSSKPSYSSKNFSRNMTLDSTYEDEDLKKDNSIKKSYTYKSDDKKDSSIILTRKKLKKKKKKCC